MSKNIFNNVRIIPRDGQFLGRITGNSGDVYFNKNLNSLRIFNGDDAGGYEVVTEGNLGPILGTNEFAGVVHAVTVARNEADDANVYFIDGVEKPNLTFIKGFTYVFDQSDSSNLTFGGGQPHPLYISTDSLGATRTDTNVTYLLEDIPVSFDKYVTDFARYDMRRVVVSIKNTTPETLYYNCRYHAAMGASVTSGLPGSGSGSASVSASDTAPEEPTNGSVWFNTLTGKLYVYIDDGDSEQWVQPASPVISDINQLNDADSLIPSDINQLNDADSLIPTDLTDLGIVDGTPSQVLTTDGAGNFTFEDASGGGGGSFDQDLNTTNDVEFASVSAATFTNTGVGVPTITSATTLTLTAADGVEISSILSAPENLSTISGATGVVAHNLDQGAVFNHTTPAADFTANFTNVTTTNDRTTSIALIVNQGSTAYMPTAVQISGAAQTILWQGGSAPSGTVNGIDVVSFTLVRVGGSWTVIGSGTSYS